MGRNQSRVSAFATTIVLMEGKRPGASEPAADAWQAAVEYGIDIGQLDFLMTLSPAERLRRHEIVRPLIVAARQAGIDYYGFDPRSAETTE